eukprot:gene28114-37009_t
MDIAFLPLLLSLWLAIFQLRLPTGGASKSEFLQSENELWSDRCNIERRLLSTILHFNFQLPNIPIVYENDISDRNVLDEVQTLASRSFLLNNYNSQVVKLTSSNSYSQGEVTMSLGEYIFRHVDSMNFGPANESLYLFGGNYDGIWKKLTAAYPSPPCKYCDKAGVETFGIGGRGSGVSFHVHGPGFSEPLVAYKFGDYGPNTTALSWLRSQYQSMMQALQSSNLSDEANDGSESDSSCEQGDVETLRNLGSQLQECSLRPGEVLYFPAMWPHATLNTDAYNAFVSVFIDPQLMRD